MKNSKKYQDAKRTAIDKAAGATPLSGIFEAGFDFAVSQPKHLLDTDYLIEAGEVRRYKGDLYRVLPNEEDCKGCAFIHNPSCDDKPCENGVIFVKI